MFLKHLLSLQTGYIFCWFNIKKLLWRTTYWIGISFIINFSILLILFTINFILKFANAVKLVWWFIYSRWLLWLFWSALIRLLLWGIRRATKSKSRAFVMWVWLLHFFFSHWGLNCILLKVGLFILWWRIGIYRLWIWR